jgi:type II secretory pathway component PulF
MSEHFPTFGQLLDYPPWKSSTLWPADTLGSKQKSLLRILHVAAADRLEAAPLVAALATEHRSSYRRRLRRLARRLASGTSLADALEQTPGVLSDEHSLAIRFGDQSGTLAATLTGLLNHTNRAELRVIGRLRQLGFYVVTTATIFLFIMSFFLIKIIPSFQAIFDDFDLGLPHITILMIVVSQLLVNYWFLFALALIVGYWLTRSQSSRRFFSRQVSSRVIRPIAKLRMAQVFSLLATNSRAGRPLSGALSTLARYHFDPKVRHKLLFVRNEMEQGANVWESMATAKLLSSAEARALEKATSSQSRAWTMERLADIKRGQVEQRTDFYVSLLQPAVTLLMAGIVLFVAVACLLPVFELTSALTG